MDDCWSRPLGSRQWPIRQISYGTSGKRWSGTRQDDGSELVCGVSMPDDGSYAHDTMVAQTQADYPIPLGLEYHLCECVPQCRRLCLFLCPHPTRGNDQYRLYDTSRKCACE